MRGPSVDWGARSEHVALLFSADWVAIAARRNEGVFPEGPALATDLRKHAVDVMRAPDPPTAELTQRVLAFHARYAAVVGGMQWAAWRHLCTRGRAEPGGSCPVCTRSCIRYGYDSHVYRSYAREVLICPRCGPVVDREVPGFDVRWSARRLADPRRIAVHVRGAREADSVTMLAALEHNGSDCASVSEPASGTPAALMLEADVPVSRGVEWVTLVCLADQGCVLTRRPLDAG
jgi:hypothetical protein